MNLYNATRAARAAADEGDTETAASLIKLAETILGSPGMSPASDEPVARCCAYRLADGRIHCGENEMTHDDGAVPSRGEQILFPGTADERRAACQFCAATCEAEIIRIKESL